MNRRRVAPVRWVATVIGIAPLLASCAAGQGSSSADKSPAPASTADVLAPPLIGPADVARLPPGGGDQITSALSMSSRAAADELLTRTGIVDVLPNAGEALAALEPRPETLTGPAGLRRGAPLSSQGAVLGLSTLGAALNGSLRENPHGAPLNEEGTVDYGPATADTPTMQVRMVDGSTEVRLVLKGTEAIDGGQLAAAMDLRGKLDACPAADGTVVGTLSLDVRVDATAGAQRAGARYTLDIELTASVDDAARLTGYVIDASGSASDTVATTSDGGDPSVAGWFVEGGSRTTLTGRPADGITVTGLEDAVVSRQSTGADDASAASFLANQSSIAAHLGAFVLVGAESFWRGGACVDVQLVPAGDPSAVQPGDELTVGVEATAAADGQPIAAPATAVATATGGTLEPAEVAQPLPATVRYFVPADGADGEITAEVTSRRGIGTATLAITAVDTIVVDGPLDVFHATGTKCGGVGGEWELALTASFEGYPFTGTLRFELDPGTRTGTYTLTGSTSGGGITVDQRGSGTVKTLPAPNGPTLVFTGTAWTGGPVQVISIDTRRVPGTDC